MRFTFCQVADNHDRDTWGGESALRRLFDPVVTALASHPLLDHWGAR
jgi:hypothetical protein